LDAHRAAAYEQLEFEIDELVARAMLQASQPAPAPVRQTAPTPASTAAPTKVLPRETFGHWLLSQTGRDNGIDELAVAARTDPGFPRNGTPADVRARLRRVGAPDDAFDQLDDAEHCWMRSA
jgi:hypothetical protein